LIVGLVFFLRLRGLLLQLGLLLFVYMADDRAGDCTGADTDRAAYQSSGEGVSMTDERTGDGAEATSDRSAGCRAVASVVTSCTPGQAGEDESGSDCSPAELHSLARFLLVCEVGCSVLV
jgi:hypothetical protein